MGVYWYALVFGLAKFIEIILLVINISFVSLGLVAEGFFHRYDGRINAQLFF